MNLKITKSITKILRLVVKLKLNLQPQANQLKRGRGKNSIEDKKSLIRIRLNQSLMNTKFLEIVSNSYLKLNQSRKQGAIGHRNQ
jgi:hypothetical protein